MTPLTLAVLVLASHRLTHLFTEERWAERAVARLRPLATRRLEGRRPVTGELLGERFVVDRSRPLTWRVLYGLLSNHWSVGIGSGTVTVALWSSQHGWFQWAAYALAAASGSGILHDLTKGRS